MSKRKLRRELSEFSRKTEATATLYSGSLGIYIGGTQYVDVPNRPGFVYVRLRNNISELIQAHNEVVSPVYGLPVLLIRNKTYYEIYGRDSVQYGSYWDSSSSYLPKHGHQHEFDPDNNGGGDLVFVHGEQFYPMMTFPSGSEGGNTVLIAPYRYFYSSAWHYTGNTGVGNLLTYGPTGANNAKLLLVGVDATTGNPFVKQGSEFSEGITGAAALTSFVPTNITQSTEIPGAIIRLVTGTQTITWANIYDARQYMMGGAGSSSGGGGTGTYFDGIQETFYPTISVSDVTGTYYNFDFVPGDGTELDSPSFSVGNNQTAFTWVTTASYDLKRWLLRGQYSLIIALARQAGSHPMAAYCKLYLLNGAAEELVATSPLAQMADGTTAIPDTLTDFVFRLSLAQTASMENGPIRWLQPGIRLLLRVYVNASSGGSDGYLICYPDYSDAFNVNLQRQVLDNHYLTTTGSGGGATTFLALTDTPSSYSGQADKLVTVNAAGNALVFRTNTGSFGTGGGGGGSLGLYGQDEAVGLGTGTTLNVVGSDISLSISGTVLTLLHSDPTGTPHSFLDLTDTPDSYSSQGSKFVAVNSGATALEFVAAPAGGGGGGSGLVVYDDSAYKVTGTAISFDSNLSVAVTGSVAFVSATNTTGIPTNGWISDANTWSYLSSDSPSFVVSVNANITGSVGLGNKIWLNHLSQNKYFIVTGESITGSTTYFNLYGGTDYSLTTGTISSPYYSLVRTPSGFPLDPSKWTVTISDTTLRSQGSPVNNTWYNLGSISLTIPIGSWFVQYDVVAGADAATAIRLDTQTTLSTANNSESDTGFTHGFGSVSTLDINGLHKEKILLLTSKTIYYLNTRRTQAGTITNLYNFNSQGEARINATCAYL